MRLSFKDWKNFVDKGILPKIHINHVNHWLTSRELGIDPKTPILHSKKRIGFTPSDTTKYLISEAKKVIQPDLNITKSLRLAWVLCGTDGTVIEILSENQDILNHFAAIELEQGSNLSTESTGTQAISMAMDLNYVTLCHMYENYSCFFHPYISVASPIFTIEGEVMGYIGIFCYSSDGCAPNLQVSLRLVIQTLDAKMRIRRLAGRFHTLQDRLESVIIQAEDPKLTVDTNGDLRQINPAAIKLLGLGENITKKHLDNLVRFTPKIRDIAASAIEQNGQKMTIVVKGRKHNVLYNSAPVVNRNDKFIGVVISLEHVEGQQSSKTKIKTTTKSTQLNTFDDIVGESHALTSAKELAKQVARSSVSVLLTGESGTGKEMFAQSIHTASEFRNGPFVSLNCSAIPRELAESELFGYARGAFTGALKDGRIGKLEAANGGTIFLDEIGEMPMEVQAKLLRVLETRTISRVGENRERPINIRVIAATNRDLKQRIEDKKFREDLYYRIAVSNIRLPSLRTTREDIPALFQNFINIYNESMGKIVEAPSEELLNLLIGYPWRGNIRELRNAAEYCVMMNIGNEPVMLKHLPGDMRMAILYPEAEDIVVDDPLIDERKGVQESEAVLIQKALALANNKVEVAAKQLGVSRATLYRKIKKLKEQGRML